MHLAPEALPERKQRTVRGIVQGVEDDAVRMEVDGEALRVPLDGIRKARLDPDL